MARIFDQYSKDGIYEAISRLWFLRDELSRSIRNKFVKPEYCICPEPKEDIIHFLIRAYAMAIASIKPRSNASKFAKDMARLIELEKQSAEYNHDRDVLQEDYCVPGTYNMVDIMDQLACLEISSSKFSPTIRDVIVNSLRKAISFDEEDSVLFSEAHMQYTPGADEFKLKVGVIRASHSVYMMIDTSEIARAADFYYKYETDGVRYPDDKKTFAKYRKTIKFFKNLTVARDAFSMIARVLENPLVMLRDNLPEADYDGNLVESCNEYIAKIQTAINEGICNIVGVGKGADVYEISRIRRYLVSAFNILTKVFYELDQKNLKKQLQTIGFAQNTLSNIKNELATSAYVSSGKLDMLANVEVWSRFLYVLHGRYIDWLVNKDDGELEGKIQASFSERNFWKED